MLHYIFSVVLVTVSVSSFSIGLLVAHNIHMRAMKDAMKKEIRNAGTQEI